MLKRLNNAIYISSEKYKDVSDPDQDKIPYDSAHVLATQLELNLCLEKSVIVLLSTRKYQLFPFTYISITNRVYHTSYIKFIFINILL